VYLGETRLTPGVTEMGRQPSSVQSSPKVKSVNGHLSGLPVHKLSKVNMPSTIAERGSQKLAASDCRKSDNSTVLLTKYAKRPLSIHSVSDIVAKNGHSSGHLSKSLSELKLKTSHSHEVPATSVCDKTSSKKRHKSGDKECYSEQKKVSTKESCCSKTLQDSCIDKIVSLNNVHVQPSSVESFSSKSKCRRKKKRVETSSSNSQICDKVFVVKRSSPSQSVDIAKAKRKRKHRKKSSKTKAVSTASWFVVKHFDVDSALRSPSNKVCSTTSWHVTEYNGESTALPASVGGNDSAVQSSSVTSAACNEAVRGGQQQSVSKEISTPKDICSTNGTSGQTVSCAYWCQSTLFL